MYFTRENNWIFSGSSHRIIRIIDLIWKICETVICWSTGTGSSLLPETVTPNKTVTYQLDNGAPAPRYRRANRMWCHGWTDNQMVKPSVQAFVTDWIIDLNFKRRRKKRKNKKKYIYKNQLKSYFEMSQVLKSWLTHLHPYLFFFNFIRFSIWHRHVTWPILTIFDKYQHERAPPCMHVRLWWQAN